MCMEVKGCLLAQCGSGRTDTVTSSPDCTHALAACSVWDPHKPQVRSHKHTLQQIRHFIIFLLFQLWYSESG